MKTLEKFDPRDVVWDRNIYASQSIEHSNYFVRTVRATTASHVLPLIELLSIADDHMNRIAENVGGIVLPHVWGLISVDSMPAQILSDHQKRLRIHPDMPDWILAAQVETISCQTSLASSSHEYKEIHVASVRYREQDRVEPNAEEFRLCDIDTRQFSIGQTISLPGNSLILHDIEPLMVRV